MKSVFLVLVSMSPFVSQGAFAKNCEWPEYKAPKGYVCDSRGFLHPVPSLKNPNQIEPIVDEVNTSESIATEPLQELLKLNTLANNVNISLTEFSIDLLMNGEKASFKSLYFKEYGYALLFPRFEIGQTSSFISAGGTTPESVCKLFGLKIGQFPESAVEFSAPETPKVSFDENLNFKKFTKGGVVYRFVKCF
jgi:hypothetical protein